uniref:Putative positive regulation of cartilage development n=1 Tax=Ixodes ricinus TaxID=34613 RepID=V5H612_IXORI
MKLAWAIFALLQAQYATPCCDHRPFNCGGKMKISSIFQCDGIRQCPNNAVKFHYAYEHDEGDHVCVSTPYLRYEELTIRAQSTYNGSVLLSWSSQYSPSVRFKGELRRWIADVENVYLAGYLLYGSSDHHTFTKTFPVNVTEYSPPDLKRWTLYEIVVRPYYTSDGNAQPVYKVGKAAYVVFRSEAAAPSVPAYAELISVGQWEVVIKVGDPTDWNGEPAGYRVRWEALEDSSEKDEDYISIPKERSVDDNSTIITVYLVPGMRYRLNISAQNNGHRNEIFNSSELEIEAFTVPLEPVHLTAYALGSHDVLVSWRASGFVEYFEVTACDEKCDFAANDSSPSLPSTERIDKDESAESPQKKDSLPDLFGKSRYLRSDDVLINVNGSHVKSSVHSYTIENLIPSSKRYIRVRSCCKDKCTPGITTQVFTRPEQPVFFKVENVSMTAFAVQINPSTYNRFQVRYCNKYSSCKTLFTSGQATVSNLTPNSTYDVEFREGLKDVNGNVVLGPAARTRVSTLSLASCTHHITSPAGIITSPHYPDIYPNGVICSWLITTAVGEKINLVFEDFDLEYSSMCENDKLSVYDGYDSDAPLLATLCGYQALPISSSSSQLYMVFESDGELREKGFNVTHSTSCGGRVLASGFNEQRIYSHAKYGEKRITLTITTANGSYKRRLVVCGCAL